MTEQIEIRRVQAYAREKKVLLSSFLRSSQKGCKIEKGDFLKVHLENSKLILEKAYI